MDPAGEKRLSKFLSFVLRQDPGSIGLTLDEGGWAAVEDIVAGAGFPTDAGQIAHVVRASDKQRFALSPDGARIRANQGHSLPVDLGLAPVAPPEVLYHGTAQASLSAILAEGLRPMGRQHVHLSPDPDTAVKVGQRHGRPVVLLVAAGRLAADGQIFYLSANGVWLTGAVAPEYLTQNG